MTKQYKRRHIKMGDSWVQVRANGKHKSYSLCEGCALNKPEAAEQCKRVIGLGNFCKATKMVVVVWQCPNFIEKEEEHVVCEPVRPVIQQEEVPGA